MTYIRSPRTLADLRPGEHLCVLYETPEEHRSVLTAFMRQGLLRGDKVVYITGERGHAPESILNYLRDDGQDVEFYLACGQLLVRAGDDAHLQRVALDPGYAIATLRAEIERALSEGFTALRISSEMPWLQAESSGPDHIVAYEAQLNEFLQDSPCLLLCQYDQQRLAPAISLDALRTHPATIVGATVYDNFYYVPPTKLLSQASSVAELRRRIDNLTNLQRAEEKCRAYREHLELIRNQGLRSSAWRQQPELASAPLHQRNPELALLNRVSQVLNNTRDPGQALTTVLEVTRRLLDVPACAAWLNDTLTSELVCLCATGLHGATMRGQRLAPGQGLVGRVAQSGECLIVPDARAATQYQVQDIPALRSILSVPLWVNANVVGVIQIMDTQAARFDHADLTLVKSLALSAAAAIENAWLYREARTLQIFNENMLQSMKKDLLRRNVIQANNTLVNKIAEPWVT